MLTAQVILYSVLVIVNVATIIAWIAVARRRRLHERPKWSDAVIGCVTSFLDMFGIGSYAQITALFKQRGRPSDELIPGTLNVGSAVPAFLASFLFFAAITVEPILLAAMVISSSAGAWLGAGVVSRMSRRSIQLVMGMALMIAAGFLAMTAVGVLPPSGTALGLSGRLSHHDRQRRRADPGRVARISALGALRARGRRRPDARRPARHGGRISAHQDDR
jgi:uncharacterized membrane protein YfcA